MPIFWRASAQPVLLRAVAPQDLVYDFGVESLFKGLGDRLTPALREKVRGLGIDLDKKLLPGYPKDLWVRVVDQVAQELSGGHELSEARRELGHVIASGFAQGTLGRLMAPGVRLMGVRRMLLRLPRSLTMSNNFLRVAVSEVGPHAVRVEMNEAVPSVEFLRGVIEAIASYAGAQSCTVSAAPEGPLMVFMVSWT